MFDYVKDLLLKILFALTKSGEIRKELPEGRGYALLEKSWLFGKLKKKDNTLKTINRLRDKVCKPLGDLGGKPITDITYTLYFYDLPYKFSLEYKSPKGKDVEGFKNLFEFWINELEKDLKVGT